jgi:PIN domain nuclease of toxin-antitoxin system
VNYLIDTHILIWYALNDNQLSPKITDVIKDLNNQIFLSKASLWEMAIKINIGKLDLQDIPFENLEKLLSANNIIILDIQFKHFNALLSLPLYHADPFDRLIISQAVIDDFTVISDDNKFKLYPIKLFN